MCQILIRLNILLPLYPETATLFLLLRKKNKLRSFSFFQNCLCNISFESTLHISAEIQCYPFCLKKKYGRTITRFLFHGDPSGSLSLVSKQIHKEMTWKPLNVRKWDEMSGNKNKRRDSLRCSSYSPLTGCHYVNAIKYNKFWMSDNFIHAHSSVYILYIVSLTDDVIYQWLKKNYCLTKDRYDNFMRLWPLLCFIF